MPSKVGIHLRVGEIILIVLAAQGHMIFMSGDKHIHWLPCTQLYTLSQVLMDSSVSLNYARLLMPHARRTNGQGFGEWGFILITNVIHELYTREPGC